MRFTPLYLSELYIIIIYGCENSMYLFVSPSVVFVDFVDISPVINNMVNGRKGFSLQADTKTTQRHWTDYIRIVKTLASCHQIKRDLLRLHQVSSII